jgi:hypothetical protein
LLLTGWTSILLGLGNIMTYSFGPFVMLIFRFCILLSCFKGSKSYGWQSSQTKG